MSEMVLIEHRDGRSYAVLPKDFEKGADGDYKGFRITSYEDGTPYEGPKTLAALSKAQDTPAKAEKGADKPEKGGE